MWKSQGNHVKFNINSGENHKEVMLNLSYNHVKFKINSGKSHKEIMLKLT